jgi:hypothetical protein
VQKALFITGLICFCIILVTTSPLHAGWTIDGAPICNNMGNQNQPQICSDDAGGAIVTWLEARFYPAGIYAQRISELGRSRWTEGGIEIIRPDYSANRPRIVADGSGGAIIVWERYDAGYVFDLYAQRVDSLGNLLWNEDGVAVCTAAGDQEWSVICSDGTGGCIIAWIDERTSPNGDIYAQRIDASSTPVWTVDGITICTADSIQQEVRMIADGSGGAIMVWMDYRAEGDLYAQKVNGSGVVQWAADGVPICLLNNTQYDPVICTDGAGGVFVAWYDRRDFSFDLYMQRIASDGSEVFVSGGITICSEANSQRASGITADGVGGAIVVWEDFRGGADRIHLYSQRVNASGTKLWSAASGVPIRQMSGYAYHDVIISDQQEGAIISWSDTRNIGGDNGYDVYAQRIDDTGMCLWRENGDSLCTAMGTQANLTATTDGAGGMIVAWRDTRNPDDDIYGQRINSDGTFTAVLLQSFTAAHEESAIRIIWTLTKATGDLDFIVTRKSGASKCFEEISNPAIERNGRSFEFRDDSCDPGVTYTYRIDVCDGNGKRTLFETDPITTPAASLRLFQNHPNPFNPSTTIRYYLPGRCHVTLEIFDVSGHRIACLVDRMQNEGIHRIIWNGTDYDNDTACSGVYLYRLTAGKRTVTKKMMALR